MTQGDKLGGSCCYIFLWICCRLLIASGIKDIKYIEDYKNDNLVNVFCEQAGVSVNKI